MSHFDDHIGLWEEDLSCSRDEAASITSNEKLSMVGDGSITSVPDASIALEVMCTS